MRPGLPEYRAVSPPVPTHDPASLAAGQLPAPRHVLVCHPATPCPVPLHISATLALAGTEEGPGLLLRYDVLGDMARLRIPEAVTPGAADGLWQHTCLEAFMALPGEQAYREFNFSPSGQWAAYRFSAARVRQAHDDAAQPVVTPALSCHQTTRTLQLEAWLPSHALPAARAGQPLLIGLSAVIETTDGQLSYWGLHHPGERPDFHHPGARTLSLALPWLDLSPPSPSVP